MVKFFNVYKGLSKEVYKIALVRFILSMGNFIFPFMTLFLVKKLSIAPHITSIFVISSGLMFIPASILSGKISDIKGRRFILLISFIIYITIIFIIFFLYHFNILRNIIIALLLIVANLFLSMTQIPLSAIITDVTNHNNRNEAFSLAYLGTNVGFAFGPLIAGFLFENYTSMIFLGNGISSLIGLLILTGIKETKPENYLNLINEENINEENFLEENFIKESSTSALSFILRDKMFLLFIFSTILFSFGYSQAGFTLPIFLTNLFSSNGAKFYGILQSINALTVIFFTPFVSLLSKKKSPILMVGIAGIFYAIGFGLYGFLSIIPFFILATIIWSIGEIIHITNQNVFIANRSPINLRGRVNGAFQILNGIGFMVGPVFSGFYQKYFEIKYLWFIVFFISLMGSLQLIMVYKKNNNLKVNY